MITILTEELGTVSAVAYGVRSKKGKLAAATQMLCYGEFVLSKKSGDIYRIDAAEIVDAFFPIAEDLQKLALANYLVDLAIDAYSDSDSHVLSLLLNTLYAISYKDVDVTLAKAVFELKLMQYAGYEPNIKSCIVCGKEENLSGFSFSGGVVCSKCKNNACLDISLDLYRAMCYILTCEEKKIFSFTLTNEIKSKLSSLCEKYLLSKSERGYKSLEYFKKII